MLHTRRQWVVRDIETVDELCSQLVDFAHAFDAGFRFGGLLFLNDAIRGSALKEFAVVRESDGRQLDFLPASFLHSVSAAKEVIEDVLSWSPRYVFRLHPSQIVGKQFEECQKGE